MQKIKTKLLISSLADLKNKVVFTILVVSALGALKCAYADGPQSLRSYGINRRVDSTAGYRSISGIFSVSQMDLPKNQEGKYINPLQAIPGHPSQMMSINSYPTLYLGFQRDGSLIPTDIAESGLQFEATTKTKPVPFAQKTRDDSLNTVGEHRRAGWKIVMRWHGNDPVDGNSIENWVTVHQNILGTNDHWVPLDAATRRPVEKISTRLTLSVHSFGSENVYGQNRTHQAGTMSLRVEMLGGGDGQKVIDKTVWSLPANIAISTYDHPKARQSIANPEIAKNLKVEPVNPEFPHKYYYTKGPEITDQNPESATNQPAPPHTWPHNGTMDYAIPVFGEDELPNLRVRRVMGITQNSSKSPVAGFHGEPDGSIFTCTFSNPILVKESGQKFEGYWPKSQVNHDVPGVQDPPTTGFDVAHEVAGGASPLPNHTSSNPGGIEWSQPRNWYWKLEYPFLKLPRAPGLFYRHAQRVARGEPVSQTVLPDYTQNDTRDMEENGINRYSLETIRFDLTSRPKGGGAVRPKSRQTPLLP